MNNCDFEGEKRYIIQLNETNGVKGSKSKHSFLNVIFNNTSKKIWIFEYCLSYNQDDVYFRRVVFCLKT